MQVELIHKAEAIIGESPTWVAEDNALYWIDVKAPSISRLEMNTGYVASWHLSSDIGAFALLEGRMAAVVALREGIFRFEFSSGKQVLLAPAPFDPRLFRFNEGACDHAGRFWVGTMFDPQHKDDRPVKSSLHSFTLDDLLRPEPDAAELYNGMGWTPGETHFYVSHTQKRAIYRFKYDPPNGALSEKRLFAQIAEGQGLPDGAAVDADGGYWCALHGAGKIRRYTSDGAIDCEINLPVSQPTMCAFGGHDRSELFITSATDGLSQVQRSKEPLAGSIFKVKTQTQGVKRFFTVR